MQFGDFLVIEMLYGYKIVSNKPKTYCRCLGIDNKEYIIRADALRNGATKTIKGACRAGKKNDLVGQRFGKLVVMYQSEGSFTSNGHVLWHCVCDCGTELDVFSSNLISGHTQSCGCNHKSQWEIFIADYLTKLNIDFEEQKRFSDCRNQKGSDMLPFDFFIASKNIAIEYDGQHHFEPVKGWGGVEKFKKTKENDLIKNKYCIENNITLIRIPYTYSKEQIKNILNNIIHPVTTTVA